MCNAAVFHNQYSEYKTAKKYSLSYDRLYLAGETRFEHATYGFGDRYSTVEPLPCVQKILYRIHWISSRIFPMKT